MDYEKECIEACLDCAIACEKCASLCLEEAEVKMMVKCVLLDRECAAVCFATAKVLAVGADHNQILLRSCEELCIACGKECAKHANMMHCKECAEACRRCADLCRKMIDGDSL